MPFCGYSFFAIFAFFHGYPYLSTILAPLGFSPGLTGLQARPEGGARGDVCPGFVLARSIRVTGHINTLIHCSYDLGRHFQGDFLYDKLSAKAGMSSRSSANLWL